MRKIYLVKKNPEQPADGNNWIVMNSFEFMNFVKTPEGQKRKACFGQLDACSVDDVIIIAECGAETAKQWRSEKDRHDYLASIEKQSGMTVFSYNTQTATENEMSGEELLADNQCDVVEEVLRRFQKAHIQETLATLLPEERDLIESLIIREILATEDLNEDALLRIFDGVTAAFYKSDEYNSREYRYSNLSELRKAMKHKEGGTNGKAQ